MKTRVFKRSAFSSITAVITASLFTCAAVVMVMYGLKQAERSSIAEGRRILEDGVRRAVITCYAIEGSYPESLSYIEENYGINIDKAKYTVFYEIDSSNIFPAITILESEEGL